MSDELIGGSGIIVLLVLMFLNIPIALCMVLVGFAGFALISGSYAAWNLAGMAISSSVADYTLATIPVFLLMGELANISGMMTQAYKSTNVWLGNIRGGLAMASILGAAAFSAVSGTSIACAAIMSKIALPQLLDHKYDPALATGALAAGGTLGNLIPPGVLLVFYALMTESSLGQLFIACLLPGALLAIMYIGQVYFQCRMNPSLGPAAGSTTVKEKIVAVKGFWSVATVFGMVMGGIWFGVFTPNEAASMGTVFILVYAVVRRTVTGQNLVQALRETIVTSGMVFAVIVGANIFSSFTAISGLPQALAGWLQSLNLSAIWVVIMMMVVYFILGIPLNPMTMVLLTIPIFLPILIAYKIDLVWFGVLTIVQMELAGISPPVGMNMFVVAAMAAPRGITLSTVFRGSLPFCITMIVFTILLIAFPQIAMWPVSLMR